MGGLLMTDLAIYRPPTAGELEQTWLLADRFSRTEFVPAAIRGKAEAVMACMLAGRELGIGPMQALQKIHIIQGRPTLSAELMASLVRRAGHRIRTIERSNTVATVEGARADDPDAAETLTWTIDDAKRAELQSKENWKKYPSAMLWARAVSQLCRQLCPDVLAGMSYTPDEAGETEAVWGDPEVEVEGVSPGPEPVTPRPAGPGAVTTFVPTIADVNSVRYVSEAKAVIKASVPAFQALIPKAIHAVHHADPHAFWDDRLRNTKDWKDVLEWAVEAHEQHLNETPGAA